jgi:hypothetical protein
MRIIPISLVLSSLLFAGCCKQFEDLDKKTSNTCNCPNLVKQVDSSSVIGCWVLTDSLIYNVSLKDSVLVPVHGDSVVIRLNADSSFCSDASFPWSSAHYDHFRMQGNYLYLFPGGYGSSVRPAGIILAGNDELILVQSGVDAGVEEHYKRQ